MIDTTPLLPEGTLVCERYRVVRCLKTGAMGGIYQVLDVQTDRFRALKTLLPDAASDEDLQRRFEQEAVVAGRVRSEHVVAVTDSGAMSPSGARFLVMELLEGVDLGVLLRERGRLEPDEVVEILEQAARGLERIHREGIVHRDLKPENIFVCARDDGERLVKIIDFGIAKNIASLATLKTTRALGTPLYMAPEQLTGDATIDARADLHALGLVAYALLVGKPYWLPEAEVAPSAYAFCNAVIDGPKEAATTRARRDGVELPAAFDAWFARAVAARPEDRFESAEEQIAGLVLALGDHPAPLPQAGSLAEPRPRSSRPVAAVAVALGVVALGLVAMEPKPFVAARMRLPDSFPLVAPPAPSSPATSAHPLVEPSSAPPRAPSRTSTRRVAPPPEPALPSAEPSSAPPRRDPLDDL